MQPNQGQTYWQPDQDEEMASGGEGYDAYDAVEEAPDEEPLMWQASEYIQHEKQVFWYFALVVITVILFLISAFLIKSWSFAALVVVLGIAVGVMARRPPHTVRYALSSHGLEVDGKPFAYSDFRAFGVLQDGPLSSIVLIPNKRFMPAVNVYFPLEHGEEIVDIFGSYLPMERVEPDFVEKLARKLRF